MDLSPIVFLGYSPYSDVCLLPCLDHTAKKHPGLGDHEHARPCALGNSSGTTRTFQWGEGRADFDNVFLDFPCAS